MAIWWIVGYIVMIVVTFGFAVQDRDNIEDVMKSFFLSLFWPIVVVVAGAWALGYGLDYLLRDILKWKE